MDDIRAVMDAAGSERAALHGAADGAALALLFAATYPDRAAALVLHGPRVRGSWAPDYPWGERDAPTPPGAGWTSAEMVESVIRRFAPSRVGDAEYARWNASYLRLSASPTTAAALFRMFFDIDVRHVLPAVDVRTGRGSRLSPTGCSQLFSSRTSSVRPSGWRHSATRAGATSCASTTRSCGGSSAASVDGRWTRPATVSYRRAGGGRSGARRGAGVQHREGPRFRFRGRVRGSRYHELKGIPGEWRLFAVTA
jgi:hypothetical protein